MKAKILMTLIVMFGAANIALSEENSRISVQFNAPEKFTDFKSSANISDHNRKELMEQLRQLIIKSTHEYIAVDSRMEFTINNIDMAGTFLYGNNELYRVVDDTDRIRIDFSYKLFDNEGNVIKQDDVNLKSLNPKVLSRLQNKYKNTSFTYEMPLFDKWIEKLDI